MKQRLASLLATAGLLAGMAFVSVGVPAAAAAPATPAPDSLGTDFWLTFPDNVGTPNPTLFISGPTATTGTVAYPGHTPTVSVPFTVTPGSVTSVNLPSSLVIDTSDVVGDLGIHVTAGEEITVEGLNQAAGSTDAYLGLPTDILGTEYLVLDYSGGAGAEFALVATQDGTTVTITPSEEVAADGGGTHAAGVPYSPPTMNAGQTYQLGGGSELTGSIVSADKPIAVFAGNRCANIPEGVDHCDHLVEEMTPTNTWGTTFVTEPLATRTGGDVFRYLAGTDDTDVKVNGTTVATLDRGQFHEEILTAASVITSSEPILVAQYSHSHGFDGVDASDPFEALVVPTDQFMTSYTLNADASGFSSHYLNVVAPTSSLASVTLDGVLVPLASFSAIDSTFSGAQLHLDTAGAHTLSGSLPLGVTVYGFADSNAYGYPGGLSFQGATPVTHLTLVKTVVNDGGGTADPTDWTLSADGPTPISGATGTPEVTNAVVDAGTYELGEDGPTGYNASAWNCTGGTLTGNSLVLAAGDDASCSITNTLVIVGQISALGDAHGWIGLKNSDDMGTRVDLRVELLKNGTPVPGVWGIQRCIQGINRNPLLATEGVVPWNAFSPVPVATGDVIGVRVSARIGTNPDGTRCAGHGSANGLRFYYDATGRKSRFAARIGQEVIVDFYFHSDGTACNNTESQSVTIRSLDSNPSVGALPGKCKDSGALIWNGNNKWATIADWSLAPLP